MQHRTKDAHAYLADGIYLKFEAAGVWLLTEREVGGQQHVESIMLEWEVLNGLNEFCDRFRKTQSREEDTTT